MILKKHADSHPPDSAYGSKPKAWKKQKPMSRNYYLDTERRLSKESGLMHGWTMCKIHEMDHWLQDKMEAQPKYEGIKKSPKTVLFVCSGFQALLANQPFTLICELK